MNIQPSVSRPLLAKAPLQQTPPPAPPQEPVEGEGVSFRDVAALGAGALAGVAGAVVGLGEGTIKGAIKNFPAHVGKGADIGQAVGTPVGKVLGGAGAVALIGAGAVAAPALTVLAAAGGAINGTITGAVLQAETEIPKAVEAGAKWGETTFASALQTAGAAVGGALAGLAVLPTIVYPPLGKTLIPAAYAKGQEWGGKAGEFAGSHLGEALGTVGGAVAGVGISTYKGLPMGYEMGKEAGKETASMITDLPDFARETWNAGYHGGGDLVGGAAGFAGGTVGVLTASGATVFSAIETSAQRASGWASATAEFVRGEKAAEQPPAATAPVA